MVLCVGEASSVKAQDAGDDLMWVDFQYHTYIGVTGWSASSWYPLLCVNLPGEFHKPRLHLKDECHWPREIPGEMSFLSTGPEYVLMSSHISHTGI